MKWYKTFDYHTRRYYWWTQRDKNGVCYEIRQPQGKFLLYVCDNFASKFETLQKAMDQAV